MKPPLRPDGRFLVGTNPNMQWACGGNEKANKLAAWRATEVGKMATKLNLVPEKKRVLSARNPNPECSYFGPDHREFYTVYANDEEYMLMLLGIRNRKWHDVWIVQDV